MGTWLGWGDMSHPSTWFNNPKDAGVHGYTEPWLHGYTGTWSRVYVCSTGTWVGDERGCMCLEPSRGAVSESEGGGHGGSSSPKQEGGPIPRYHISVFQ